MGRNFSTAKILILLSILLIIPTLGMFVHNALYDLDHARHMAHAHAQSILNKDKSLRMWAAAHGGVYVPVDERTPPNPYLSHIPNRDIKVGNKTLTLMNPAYMLRQIMEENIGLYGARSKITSLKPLNPINAPDAWETKALKAIEAQGGDEFFEFIDEGNGEKLRYLQPFYVEEDCLKCHAHQGYKLGDLRGGISVSIPMDHYYHQVRTMVWLKVIAFTTAMVTILVIMYFVYRKIESNRLHELKQQQLIFEQSKQAAMGEMIGAITHQMKQPLNIMALSTQEVEADLDEGAVSNEVLERHINTLMTEIVYLSDTIDDFRNFFRPDKDRQYFHLHEAVTNGLKILSTQMKVHDIRIELDGENPEIYGNRNELQQVIINLINNAKDALLHNNEYDNRKIHITTGYAGKDAFLRVCDNGGGIAPEHMEKLFTPYFTTKGEQGTGIGLYMSRMIVEKSFEGSMGVTNENGGACFTLTLPRNMPNEE